MKKEILEWMFCIVIALVLAIIFKHFIGTPTTVKHSSMYPTLQENEKLVLNRTFKITKKYPNRGDIITFEAPSKASYSKFEASQSNPVAIYNSPKKNIFQSFWYYGLEVTKTSFIKRVIGLPGEHVKIENGKIYINGSELKEDYLADDVITVSEVFYDFTVPDGYIFAIGDNRSKSTDCRVFGCVPYEKIEGIVLLRFFPFDVFGKIK